MPDVLLATDNQNPTLLDDDRLLVDALSALGFNSLPAVWKDPSVDWGSAGAVVLRSVFDYTSDRERFLEWIDNVETMTTLHNPARLVRWNSHKSYLRVLEARGVPIVPTAWIDAGTTVDFASLLEERGWRDAVVKPTVGNGARGALRVTADDGRAHLNALLAERDVMIQPYLPATEEPGEHALIHIGGRFSHAIRKDQMLAGRPFSFDRTPPTDPDPRGNSISRRMSSTSSPSHRFSTRASTP